jgi:hypothetical protein
MRHDCMITSVLLLQLATPALKPHNNDTIAGLDSSARLAFGTQHLPLTDLLVKLRQGVSGALSCLSGSMPLTQVFRLCVHSGIVPCESSKS